MIYCVNCKQNTMHNIESTRNLVKENIATLLFVFVYRTKNIYLTVYPLTILISATDLNLKAI